MSTHKKQRRRSISIRPQVFVRLHWIPRDELQSLTAKVEAILTEYMNTHGVPDISREDAIRWIEKHEREAPSKPAASGVWTF